MSHPQQSKVSRAPTSTVFVGNLGQEVTDQTLTDIFGEIGAIKNVRVVTDRETGKAKGFGFCEFYDVQTAESAQRNVDGREVSGRKIRVDFADDKEMKAERRDRDDQRGPPQPTSRGPPRPRGVGIEAAASAASTMSGMLGDPAPSSQSPGGGPDQISSTLAGMSVTQLYGIMSQMKALIQQNQQQARQILVQYPQLTKGLFQAQIMLNMLKPPVQQAPQPVGQQFVHPQQPQPQQPMGPMAGGPRPMISQHAAPPPANGGAPFLPAFHGQQPFPTQGPAQQQQPPIQHFAPGPGPGPAPVQQQQQGPPPQQLQQPRPADPRMPQQLQQLPPQPQGFPGAPQQQQGMPLQQSMAPQMQAPPGQYPGQQQPPGQPQMLPQVQGHGLAQGPQMLPQQHQGQPPQQLQGQPQMMGQVQGPAPGGVPQIQGQPLQPAPAVSDAQRALLAQVMNLTPQQIELLSPQQRAQVLALQAQLRNNPSGGM